MGNPIDYDIIVASRLARESWDLIANFAEKNANSFMEDRSLKKKYKSKIAYNSHKNIPDEEYTSLIKSLKFDKARQVVILTKEGTDYMERVKAKKVRIDNNPPKPTSFSRELSTISLEDFNALADTIKSSCIVTVGTLGIVYETEGMQYQVMSNGNTEMIYIEGKALYIKDYTGRIVEVPQPSEKVGY